MRAGSVLRTAPETDVRGEGSVEDSNLSLHPADNVQRRGVRPLLREPCGVPNPLAMTASSGGVTGATVGDGGQT